VSYLALFKQATPSPPSRLSTSVETVHASLPFRLDPVTVAQVLGPHPGADAVAALEAEVVDGIDRFRDEVATGQLGPVVLQVRGRPLADFLDLDLVAELLRVRPRPGTTTFSSIPLVVTSWPTEIPGLGPRTGIPYATCQDCVDQDGRQLEESVRLSFTDEVVSWRVSIVEGTCTAYRTTPLCRLHARRRSQAAGETAS
jgi:hypothetical protein